MEASVLNVCGLCVSNDRHLNDVARMVGFALVIDELLCLRYCMEMTRVLC